MWENTHKELLGIESNFERCVSGATEKTYRGSARIDANSGKDGKADSSDPRLSALICGKEINYFAASFTSTVTIESIAGRTLADGRLWLLQKMENAKRLPRRVWP